METDLETLKKAFDKIGLEYDFEDFTPCKTIIDPYELIILVPPKREVIFNFNKEGKFTDLM